MLLETFWRNFILNFQRSFWKRLEGALFNRSCLYFSVFRRLVNNKFNHLISLFKEIIINTSFGKSNSLFGEVWPNICKNSFSSSSNFFLVKLSQNLCKRFLGSRMQKRIHNLTSKMELFSEVVNDIYSLTIFAKSSILDVRVLNAPLGSSIFSEQKGLRLR